MYSSLQVGMGLFSSLNTADFSVLVDCELMKEAGTPVFTKLVTCGGTITFGICALPSLIDLLQEKQSRAQSVKQPDVRGCSSR